MQSTNDSRGVCVQPFMTLAGLVRWAFAVAVSFTLIACGGPWRDKYFQKGIDRLTEEQIVEKLGPAHTAKTPALGGDTVWTYRYPMSDKELHPMDPRNLTKDAAALGQQAAAAMGKGSGGNEGSRETLYCYRYTLVFNEAKVLKSWKREDCVPRDEGDTASSK